MEKLSGNSGLCTTPSTAWNFKIAPAFNSNIGEDDRMFKELEHVWKEKIGMTEHDSLLEGYCATLSLYYRVEWVCSEAWRHKNISHFQRATRDFVFSKAEMKSDVSSMRSTYLRIGILSMYIAYRLTRISKTAAETHEILSSVKLESHVHKETGKIHHSLKVDDERYDFVWKLQEKARHRHEPGYKFYGLILDVVRPENIFAFQYMKHALRQDENSLFFVHCDAKKFRFGHVSEPKMDEPYFWDGPFGEEQGRYLESLERDLYFLLSCNPGALVNPGRKGLPIPFHVKNGSVVV